MYPFSAKAQAKCKTPRVTNCSLDYIITLSVQNIVSDKPMKKYNFCMGK